MGDKSNGNKLILQPKSRCCKQANAPLKPSTKVARTEVGSLLYDLDQ